MSLEGGPTTKRKLYCLRDFLSKEYTKRSSPPSIDMTFIICSSVLTDKPLAVRLYRSYLYKTSIEELHLTTSLLKK